MSSPSTFKPLVIGYPRTGFTLLVSILNHMLPLAGFETKARSRMLKAFIDRAGPFISSTIIDVFERHGLTDKLIYSHNFRNLTGGPKWICSTDPGRSCFRKYIGVKGLGDFSLVISHPVELLQYDDVVHSHSHPRNWLELPVYREFRRFSSIRHPAGALSSACFSINALASEYIQRFVPGEMDHDGLRQDLALFKLTDFNFFTGLVKPMVAYGKEYLGCRRHFREMRWEDLIENPVPAICRVAEDAGVPISRMIAEGIWEKIGHTNLTGAHRHNYRKSGGRVGGWSKWLLNEHLDIMREHGLESIGLELGYEPLPTLKEKEYTAFQKKTAALVRRGEIFHGFPDDDLFEFAFNKSNLDFSAFDFKTYDWKKCTRIERARFRDEALLFQIWEAADNAVERFNRAWLELATVEPVASTGTHEAVLGVMTGHRELFGGIEQAASAAREIQKSITASGHFPPMLIHSVEDINVVTHAGKYYAIPQSLGPVDLRHENLAGKPGVMITNSYESLMKIVLSGGE